MDAEIFAAPFPGAASVPSYPDTLSPGATSPDRAEGRTRLVRFTRRKSPVDHDRSTTPKGRTMDVNQVALEVFASLVSQLDERDTRVIETLANEAHDIADVFVRVNKSRRPRATAQIDPMNL